LSLISKVHIRRAAATISRGAWNYSIACLVLLVHPGATQGNRDHLDSNATGSLRELLRRATAQAHADVDRRMGAMIGAGARGYTNFLVESAAAILPLEHALTEAGAASLLPDWEKRRRTDALRADLAILGAQPGSCACVSAIGGEAHQLGMLYVLEGSRLGARVLLREIEASGTEGMRAATRYLRHGEGQRFWQTFLAALEASHAVRRAPHDAIAGAQAAFARFAPAVRA
jgi:heme oxygenase (biliverdin-IX-beta and delta-forming)